MAITLSDPAKVAMTTALTGRVSANGAAAFAVLGAADAVLATIALAEPPYSISGTGVATLLGVPRSAIAGLTGVAQAFEIRDGLGAVVLSGSVGLPLSGSDATIDTVDLTAGDTVQLISHTISPLN